jgi:hypothetical protein
MLRLCKERSNLTNKDDQRKETIGMDYKVVIASFLAMTNYALQIPLNAIMKTNAIAPIVVKSPESC